MPEVVHISLWEVDFILGSQDDLKLMCILVHCSRLAQPAVVFALALLNDTQGRFITDT